MTQQEEIQFIQSIINEAPLSKDKREKANRCLNGILQKYSAKIKEQQQQLENIKTNDRSREETENN